MAHNETSKIAWIAITVALAGSIYGVASGNLPKLAETTLNKANKIVDSIGSKTETVTMPDSNDVKWVEKGAFGENGYFVRDADGNGIVYALDTSKPVIAPSQTADGKKFVNNNKNLKTLKFLNKTVLPEWSSSYFSSNYNLESFSSENIDTSKVTNMSYMFYGNTALKTLNISNFNTSNVTDMAYMFTGLTSLASLDLSNFDTSNVTAMNDMFRYDNALKTLDISNFNTSNVTNMSSMFYGESYGDSGRALTSLDLSHFDTSKVTNMSYMFYGNTALKTLNIFNFNTSNVTDMRSMFYGNKSLTSIDVSNFDTSKVQNMSRMFGQLSALKTLDLSHFDTSNVTNMSGMFYSDTALETLNLSNFDMSEITDKEGVDDMFAHLSNLKTIKLDNTTASKLDPHLSSVFGSYIIDIDVAMQKQIAGALFTVPV